MPSFSVLSKLEGIDPVTRQKAFTLVEVLVVVVIIGILTAIAVPNYTDYLTRSRITQATSGLSEKRMRMEQFFQDNHTYYQAGGGGVPAISSPVCADDTTSSSYFDFSCPNPTATTYTLKAIGKSSMTGFTYTIDQANVKTTTAPAAWGNSNNCWITSKGGGC